MPPKILDSRHLTGCIERPLDVSECFASVSVHKHILIRPFPTTQSQQNVAHFRIQNVHWDFTILAENAAFTQREFNRAFVLRQYFGYLRRNPDDAPDSDFSGYNLWLSKLNSFGGDFRKAEMVKAFITSTEYRSRFGQP